MTRWLTVNTLDNERDLQQIHTLAMAKNLRRLRGDSLWQGSDSKSLDLADTVIDEVVLSSIEIDNRLHGTAKRIDKF